MPQEKVSVHVLYYKGVGLLEGLSLWGRLEVPRISWRWKSVTGKTITCKMMPSLISLYMFVWGHPRVTVCWWCIYTINGCLCIFIAASLHSHFIFILYKAYGFDLLWNLITKWNDLNWPLVEFRYAVICVTIQFCSCSLWKHVMNQTHVFWPGNIKVGRACVCVFLLVEDLYVFVF